jgi:hypothetical protein
MSTDESVVVGRQKIAATRAAPVDFGYVDAGQAESGTAA